MENIMLEKNKKTVFDKNVFKNNTLPCGSNK